jgi:hypothetical protein
MHLLDSVLSPGGIWLHVDFTYHRKEIRARLYRAVVLPLLYSFFRLTCGIEAKVLPNPQSFWRERHYKCRWRASYARASICGCIFEKPVGAMD